MLKNCPRIYQGHLFYSRDIFRETSFIWIPGLYLTQLWNSSASRCNSSAEIGGVVNQAPALGSRWNCNRVFSRTFRACDRRSFSNIWSKFPWIFFWILLFTSCNPRIQFALNSFSRVGFITIRTSTVHETDCSELIKAARCWSTWASQAQFIQPDGRVSLFPNAARNISLDQYFCAIFLCIFKMK